MEEDTHLAFCHDITFKALMLWVASCVGKTAQELGVPEAGSSDARVFAVEPWDSDRDFEDSTYGPRLCAELTHFYNGVSIFYWGAKDICFDDYEFVITVLETPMTAAQLASITLPEAWKRAMAGLKLAVQPCMRAIYIGEDADAFEAKLLCGHELTEEELEKWLLACRGKTKRELKSKLPRTVMLYDSEKRKLRRVTQETTFQVRTYNEELEDDFSYDAREYAFIVNSEVSEFFRGLTVTFCFIADDCDQARVWIEVDPDDVPSAWTHFLRSLNLPPTSPRFSACYSRSE